MACGCNKNKVKAYVYTAPDGAQTQKATEVEANAMKIRAGNVGKVEAKT
jgi:hypothetical protein